MMIQLCLQDLDPIHLMLQCLMVQGHAQHRMPHRILLVLDHMILHRMLHHILQVQDRMIHPELRLILPGPDHATTTHAEASTPP